MVQVSPNDDLIIQARSNVETSEIELLLYDIYVGQIEKNNLMSQFSLRRRMKVIQCLKIDES